MRKGVIFVLCGPTQNGKSTIIQAIGQALSEEKAGVVFEPSVYKVRERRVNDENFVVCVNKKEEIPSEFDLKYVVDQNQHFAYSSKEIKQALEENKIILLSTQSIELAALLKKTYGTQCLDAKIVRDPHKQYVSEVIKNELKRKGISESQSEYLTYYCRPFVINKLIEDGKLTCDKMQEPELAAKIKTENDINLCQKVIEKATKRIHSLLSQAESLADYHPDIEIINFPYYFIVHDIPIPKQLRFKRYGGVIDSITRMISSLSGLDENVVHQKNTEQKIVDRITGKSSLPILSNKQDLEDYQEAREAARV